MTFHDLAFMGRGKKVGFTVPLSPTNIVGNPAVAWYLGSNYITDVWLDYTTNAYTLTEKASSLTVPVRGGTINGHDYVVFTNNLVQNVTLSTDETNSIYIVMAPVANSWPSFEYIVSCPTNTGAEFEAFVIDPTLPSYAVYAGGDFAQASAVPEYNEWAVYTMDCEGTNFNLYVNGTNVLSEALSVTGQLTGIAVGADGAAPLGEYSPFRGKIAEIIVYDSIVPEQFRTNIINSLYVKYNIPNGTDSAYTFIEGEDGLDMLDEGGNPFVEEKL
jgi:hypothetical protein